MWGPGHGIFVGHAVQMELPSVAIESISHGCGLVGFTFLRQHLKQWSRSSKTGLGLSITNQVL